ncbi:lipopolysaccharide transport system permease protein [Nitrosomonas eutropha]|uniref:Transport permease protein n=1 Tax=Nitrosomonas eutropha TaxID=916 RepID=A0A1I7I8T6_9PROT|nr:ABC transporter permease [Nitrosomonas eutropha]SFU69260.1 lipopolysaccharide transport system permease protein [Nitrosomonas eutropha]
MVMRIFRPLWAYRGFILGSVKREFQSKYSNSLLGAAWTIIQPLAMIIVYTVIFSQVMKAKLPGIDSTFAYSIYLCAGVITWGLFAEITGRAQNIFLEHANLLKKLSFPRLCLPIIVVLNAGLNFSITFGLFTIFLLVTGNFPGWAFLAIFPLLLVQIAFSIGLGITLGVLNVFFRDVGQLFNVVLQFWFWLTPIVYPVTILPETARPLMDWNPMASLVSGYQTILVNGQWPHWESLWLITMLAVVFNVIGLHLFRTRAGEMVDEL